MRVLVLGAGGLLGQHLVEELQKRGHQAIGARHGDCPVEDDAAVRAAAEGCALVINSAAFTDVDGAERAPERAFAVNAMGAENAARAASAAGAAIVHISTDFVFSGELSRPYDEFDVPGPVSIYARSKRAGELLVERAAPRHHVVRVQGLYGSGGKNFASKLRRILLDKPSGLRLDKERRVQPTWARAAARAVLDIATTDRWGTWHATCGGATTWHEFAMFMAARLGVEPFWNGARSAELALAAHRPPNCLLEQRRMALYGMPPMPPWEDALDAFLEEARGP